MRWFSGLAILFYLSLLCTPQAFAVHDAKVSPLADSQLQAVQPALQQHLLSQSNDDDDPNTATLIAAEQRLAVGKALPSTALALSLETHNVYPAWQARAPPYFLTF